MTDAVENWRPITGYEGRYEVSNVGRVRSLDRVTPHNTSANGQTRTGRVLSPRLNRSGYPTIGLRSGKLVRNFFSVHRLVAVAFVPNPDGKPQVNHIDNDRANNRWDNLEWTTQTENLAHMTAQGRRITHWSGKPSPNRALTIDQAAAIRADRENTGDSYECIGLRHGASKRTVMRIIRGETYV